jgi:hypothetical protein
MRGGPLAYRMRPPPRVYHSVADILRKAKGLCTTGPAVGTPTTAPSSVASEIIRAGAGVPRRLIASDTVLQAPEISEAAE